MLNPVPGARIPTSGILSFRFQRSAEHVHQGIDIVAPKGTPVQAVAAGTVVHAHSAYAPGFSGYGRVVVVQAGPSGPWFLYAHLDRVQVQKGQQVRKGQQLGTVGASCFSSSEPTKICNGAHLHFEVSPRPYPQDSEAPRMDPVAYLQGGGGGLLLAAGVGGLGYWLWRTGRLQRWLRAAAA